jgi:hypothetical protein
VGGQELLVRVPLPIAEVWAEMQAQVEQLTGQAGQQILRAILENEVTNRVGPPHRPNPTSGCVRWGKQSGYVVFAGQKIPLERPRVRTREGQEVELESYGQLQDGKLQRSVQERMVAGLSTRNYRRAVESVLEGRGEHVRKPGFRSWPWGREPMWPLSPQELCLCGMILATLSEPLNYRARLTAK